MVVVAENCQVAVPFLAVNREHILAAQELRTEEPALAAVSEEREAAE